MSEGARSIFICPQCGAPSVATGEGDAVCSQCQVHFELPKHLAIKAMPQTEALPKASGKAMVRRNIVLKSSRVHEFLPEVADKTESTVTRNDFSGPSETHEKGERRKRLKKKTGPPVTSYLKWVTIWLGSVALLVFVFTQLQSQFSEGGEAKFSVEGRLVGEERAFFRQEYPKITKEFQRFLRAENPSQISDYVLDVKQLSRKVGQHYKDQPPRFPAKGLKESPVFWNVAFGESPGFVEVVWDGEGEGFFEAVYLKRANRWVLDWEHYVRYSSLTWMIFRQRLTSEHSGTFRLYAEKISEGENSDFKAWLKVRLLPPYADSERGRREATEPLLIEGGHPLAAAFADLFVERTSQSKGFSEVWKRDDKNLRRVQVELAWEEDEKSGEEKIVIKQLLADHWRTLDAIAEGQDEAVRTETLEKREL